MKSKMFIAVVVAVAMLASMSVFAIATEAVYDGIGDPLVATGDVTVNARVNPKITLTIDTGVAGQIVDFGAVDPETVQTDTVAVQVKSNALYTLGSAITGQDAEMGFSNALAHTAGPGDGQRGVNGYVDTYTVNVPFTTDPFDAVGDPIDYTATVTYTVTQN